MQSIELAGWMTVVAAAAVLAAFVVEEAWRYALRVRTVAHALQLSRAEGTSVAAPSGPAQGPGPEIARPAGAPTFARHYPAPQPGAAMDGRG